MSYIMCTLPGGCTVQFAKAVSEIRRPQIITAGSIGLGSWVICALWAFPGQLWGAVPVEGWLVGFSSWQRLLGGLTNPVNTEQVMPIWGHLGHVLDHPEVKGGGVLALFAHLPTGGGCLLVVLGWG